MAISCFFPSFSFAESVEIGYNIRGTYQEESGLLSVQLNIQNINAVGGTFALGFDKDKLELVTDGTLGGTVAVPGDVEITTEGYELQSIISQQQGHVLFGWYPSGSRLNALEEEKTVGTVSFRLKDGVTIEDLNKTTLFVKTDLRDIVTWDSGAWVRGEGLVDYKYNTESVRQCIVAFDYPGSDVVPVTARDVTFHIRTAGGSPLAAKLELAADTYQAESDGTVHVQLPDGNYSYRVSAEGYETKIGEIAISGAGREETVTLRTLQELVDAVADAIQIGYAQGDSANRVTKDLILPSTGADRTEITWESSQITIVSSSGNVFPRKADETVTLTATVHKDDVTAVRTFQVKVIGSSEEWIGVLKPVGPSGNGGNDDPGTNATPMPPSVTPSPDTQIPEVKFEDISSVPWASEAIIALAEAGIIKGVSQTQFAPDDSIKRGDFITLLMRLLPGTAAEGAGFSDVPADSYYYKEIQMAKNLGIAQGQEDGRFCPEDPITREDMMTLAYRALVLNDLMDDNAAPDALAGYRDRSQISGYAEAALAQLVQNGLVKGDAENCINPKQNTTRAETAVFLYRVCTKYKSETLLTAGK